AVVAFGSAVSGVGTPQQWSTRRIAIGLGSALRPYATIPFERCVERTGSLEGDWGLARDGREPQGWFDKLTAWCIRSPWLAIGLGLIFVIFVFSGLLLAGPPGEWGK